MAVISAVTFDVDGTFYNLRRARVRTALRMLGKMKVLKAYVAARETMRRLGRFDDIKKEQAQRVAGALGKPVDEVTKLIEECIYGKFFSIAARMKPYPGVKTLLEELVKTGMKLGVISDYPAEKKLVGFGMAELPWAAIINSETTGQLKPQRGPFEEAVRQLQVPAERILHVGDREEVDVAGAKAAGFKAALFVPKGEIPRTRADFAFRSYAEFLGKMKGL